MRGLLNPNRTANLLSVTTSETVLTDQSPASQFSADDHWQLHPRVALRPEPFGALAYHYDNRRLNFVRSPDLVALLKTLGDHATVRAAFIAANLDERRWPAFEKALAALAASDFLEPVEGTS